ncbi:ATP-binding cassette [Lithospermum erythrorhizon]|uniref:ATP-binding cassette n=1 Tax=Lithospermum erythrorhizon TaxID=34254 RepID=A0AAV3Q4S6_LITER
MAAVSFYLKVLERDLGFFEGGEGVNSGDIAYRFTAEAADVADTVYHLLNAVGPCLLQLSAMAAQMLAISPALSLISSLVILSVAFINGHLGEKLRKISNRAHLSVATLSAYLNEVLPSILFVKANNAELGERSRFQSLASADLLEHLKKKKMKALIPQIVRVIYFGLLFACFSGSHIVSGGSVDFSATISFITSLVLLIEPIQDAGKAYNEFKQGQPAIDRLLGLTKFKPQVHEKPNAVDLELVAGEVIFSGVSFKYREGGPLVLCGLDLHIKAGETIALVGPSGGGKTTLAKLLLRLYDTTHGSILIDGHDIRDIQLESLRRHIGIVSQDLTIFSGTIAENIGYKDLTTEIDMERVMLAARTANAADFIETLPHQYQTNVGPRGSSLSGGQKQRLAIARALYQNPSILILDEATSALDHRSEQLVRQALQHLMQNRTVLVIAHRLETVLMAERIFCIDDGKLNEVPRSSFLGDQQNSSFFTSLAT